MSTAERPASGGTVAGTAATVLTGQLAIYLAGFVTSVLISRAVGAEGRGEYYLPVLGATLAVTLANLGVESSTAVHFSERGATLERVARLSGALALIIGPLAIALLFGAYAIVGDTAFEGVPLSSIVLVAITIPLGLHQLWLTNVHLLARRLPQAQPALIVGAAVQLVAVALLFVAGVLDVTQVLVIYAASLLVSWTMMMLRARRFVALRPELDPVLARSVLSYGAKVHIGLLLSWLVLRFDVFLVSAYLGVGAVGTYSVAVIFAELGWLITNPLQQAAFSFQAQMPLRESVVLAFKAARFNVVIALVITMGFAATLWLVIPFFYGEEFRGAYDALLLLMPGVMAMAACRPLTLALARAISPWRYTAVGALAFAVNGVLNVVLLPEIGILGASAASTIAYVLMAAIYGVWTARVGQMRLREAAAFRRGDINTLRVALTTAAARLSGARPGRGRSRRTRPSDPDGPGPTPPR